MDSGFGGDLPSSKNCASKDSDRLLHVQQSSIAEPLKKVDTTV